MLRKNWQILRNCQKIGKKTLHPCDHEVT
jgi:hypothetical protein